MKSVLYITICCLGITLVSACSEKKSKPKRSIPHLIETITVKRAPLQANRLLTGTLEAIRTVQIYNEEQGKIKEINFFPGDRVNTDDVLVGLDDTKVQAEYDKSKAAYKQAQLDLKRIKKLKRKNLASDDELARAATAVEQTRAEQQLLATRLKNTRVFAPFSGIISERLKEPGDVVPLHSHVLTLFDPGSLVVKLDISEIILPSIKINQEVELRIDALGDKIFNGFVSRKYPTVDPVTRQGKIEVTLQPVPEGATPGQLVRAKIIGQTLPLSSVPFAVVRHDTSGEFVYRVKDNKAIRTNIRTGVQLGNSVEVIDGLQDGDMVLSKGFLGMRDGKNVTIKKVDGVAVKNKPDTENKTRNKNL